MRQRKLKSGVNWQGALKQKGVKQWLGVQIQAATYSTGLDLCMKLAHLQNVHFACLF
jgi:hypothetical protein